MIEAPAAGDLTGDGEMDIVADDLEGNVYAWNAKGKLIFHETSDRNYSGAPLPGDPSGRPSGRVCASAPQGGFAARRCLRTSNPEPGEGLDIIVAGEDRHVYAWHADGEPVKGFPVLVEDPEKVASVNPTSNQPTFNSNVPAEETAKTKTRASSWTPPPSPISTARTSRPRSSWGPTRSTSPGQGNESSINAGDLTTSSLGVVGASGLLSFANGRVYAIKAERLLG